MTGKRQRRSHALAAVASVLLLCSSCGKPNLGAAYIDTTPDMKYNIVHGSQPSEDQSYVAPDLTKFANDLVTNYKSINFSATEDIDTVTMDRDYPELSQVGTLQLLARRPLISGTICEFVLAQGDSEKAVEKIREILQDRIDEQAGTDGKHGAAMYTDAIELWKNNAHIVTNHDCVMLIVWEDADTIISAFNDLFDTES